MQLQNALSVSNAINGGWTGRQRMMVQSSIQGLLAEFRQSSLLYSEMKSNILHLTILRYSADKLLFAMYHILCQLCFLISHTVCLHCAKKHQRGSDCKDSSAVHHKENNPTRSVQQVRSDQCTANILAIQSHT